MALLTFYVNTNSTGGDGTTTARTGIHGDYSSLGAAVAPNATDLTASGTSVVIHCDGGADTTSIDFTNWTTNSTNYITIQVDQANRHNGTWDSSKYTLDTSVYNIFDATTPSYTPFIGLQLLCGHYDVRNLHAFNLGSGNHGIHIVGCLFRWKQYARTYGNGCTSIYAGIDQTGDPTVIYNCLLYDHFFNGEQDYADAITAVNANVIAYNNTFIGVQNAFNDGYSRVQAVNNLISGSTSVGNPNSTGTAFNATNLGTATGHSNDRTSQTFTFVNAASNNFQLASGDAGAKGFGTDLSSESTFPFTTDIAGATRIAPWDIGAFKAAGATFTTASVFPSGSSATTANGTTSERASANKAPIGVAATSAIGSPSELARAKTSVIGIQSTTGIGTVSITVIGQSQAAIANPTGIQTVASIGTATRQANENSFPVGSQANVAVRSVTLDDDVSTSVTGAGSTASVGIVGVVANENSYPTGAQASTQSGIHSASGKANVFPTDVQAISQIGAVSIGTAGNAAPSVSGDQAVGAIGILAVQATANESANGVQALSQIGVVGQASIIAITYARPVGVEVDVSVGALTEVGAANVPASDVVGSIELGTINPQGTVDTGGTGVQAIGKVGQITDADSANVYVVGVEADTQIVSVTFEYLGPAVINAVGVQANAQVGSVYVPGKAVSVSVSGVGCDIQPLGVIGLIIINNNSVSANVVGSGGPRHGGFGTFVYQPHKKPSASATNAETTILPVAQIQRPTCTIAAVRIRKR